MSTDNRIKPILKSLEQYLEIERRMGIDSFVSNTPLADTDAENRSMQAVIEEAGRCKKCPLYKTRKNVVGGEGSLTADIMFVGEAPGEDEDISGRPFVGRAGKLLTQIIQAMGYRREDVYIANALKCRPPFNRPPRPEEINACLDYLKRQIEIIRPKVVCALGRFANLALSKRDLYLSKSHGEVYLYEGIEVVPTFHPAYLLRNPAEKKAAWQDFKKALQIIKDCKRKP